MKKIILCLFVLCIMSGTAAKTRGNYVIDDSEVIVTTKDGIGTKINGNVPIETDADGTYAKFDGNVNNYIQLEALPAFDIASEGLHIVFKAKWGAFNNWSRVFDCGNGPDQFNIFISNAGASTGLTIGMNPTNTTKDMNAYVNDILTLNSFQSWDITISGNNGTRNTVSAVQSSPVSKTYTPQPPLGNALNTVERTKCYIGKSNWSSDQPFNGKIYYILVETGMTHTRLFEFDASKLLQE